MKYMKRMAIIPVVAAVLLLAAFTKRNNKPAETWIVTTIAGWSDKNTTQDGVGQKACFTWETGKSAVDGDGNLYVIDQVCLRKVDASLNVTTIQGAGAMDAEGNSLSIPPLAGRGGICVDKDNHIYLAGSDNTIYRLKSDNTAEVFAGDNDYKGKDDGDRIGASFYNPTGLCMDKAGNMYVADTYNSLVRKISASGKVTTIAGNGQIGDFKTGTGKAAQFLEFRAIAVDSKGNIYIPQNGRGSCIAKITPAGVVTMFVGDIDALTPTGANHDATGKAARFMRINALAIDKDDNLIIGENTRVRKATPAGVVTTLAGSEEETWRDAVGAKARFNRVNGLSIDAAGSIYVSDQYCIRKMTKQ